MHLVVVQHGLWGTPGNTAYLAMLLREQLKNDHFVLNSDVNAGNLTYDGIDVCGDRLHALILETIKHLEETLSKPVRAISLVGYSMGGLITRYVAGKLYSEGYFDSITPVNFITVATPHLGAWRMPSTWYNRAFNYMVPVVTSRTGYQLVLQDKHLWGKPLLCLMSHPDLLFMRALGRFQKLMLLANVFHDRPVPYCTAAIRLDNPYEKSRPVPMDPKYPSIVQPASAVGAAVGDCGSVESSPGRAAAAGAAHLAEGRPGMVRVDATGCAAAPLYSGPDGGDSPSTRSKATLEMATGPGSGAGGAVGKAKGDNNKTTAHEASRPAQCPPATQDHLPGQQQPEVGPPMKPRRLHSSYLRVLMVLCLPLAIPALLLMVITGRSHHKKMTRTALDFSWIQRYQHRHQRERDDSAAGKRRRTAAAADTDPEEAVRLLVGLRGEEEEAPTLDMEDREPEGVNGVAAAACSGSQGDVGWAAHGAGKAAAQLSGQRQDSTRQSALERPLADIECPSAPDLPAIASASAAATKKEKGRGIASAAAGGDGDPAAVSAAPAGETAAGALDDGDDEVVVVSEQAVLLHDGIVELPAEMHRVQEWLVEQLNQLPWHKVDVDCRDYHAHAAIVMRNPARFGHCRDVMDYLCDNFLRV